MGERLRRTALSTNVKERLDFSCGLLDAEGAGGQRAAHPGAPRRARAVRAAARGDAIEAALEPGDVVVTNHPAFGGSHLPDVTVVTPVFESEAGGALLGYVASRAHHAEIGGVAAGLDAAATPRASPRRGW